MTVSTHIKVFQIAVEGNTGSTGTIAESIGQLIIKNGWESYIAHGRFPRPSVSKVIRIGSDIDVVLHGLETRLFDRHGLGSRRATKNLIAQINEIKPDIIHLHHLHGYYINIAILFEYLRMTKINVVWTFHDCWSFTGHCCYFDHVGCEKWKNECNKCPQKNDYPKSFLFDRSKKNYYQKKVLFTALSNLTIVSVSKWSNNLLSQSFFKNTTHTYIYNGVDTEIFKPLDSPDFVKKKYHVDKKFVVLGVATTWSRRKGFDDFIKLSSVLDEDEVIILVGLNKKQMKGLPENVIGLSRTDSRQEMADLYGASDVLLNLSVEETFGLTTAESMSCGTPVIVYNSTASPELVSDMTGIVVQKNDIIKIRTAISKIKHDTKATYSINCRARAIEYFNKSDRLEEYVALYKSILEK
jgi:putative colanic acid biosynthesis glycosyltransferase